MKAGDRRKIFDNPTVNVLDFNYEIPVFARIDAAKPE
jgi:hypothetical protein